ncbi:hypothetical protein AB0N14_34070 [Streptomyces sp. NPDC051104]|uniref:LppU/SCO3897 family protein n=1 Tax=Streptomyces sp. NPDC051104 TaxID=3155044 RepID=UPI0034440FFE
MAIFGGLAHYVWDYNTSPTGGKAKAEASASVYSEAHDPEIGDCVKVKDPQGEPLPTVVDCNSGEAEYKLGEMLPGKDRECGSEYDYGIQYATATSSATRCASPRSDFGSPRLSAAVRRSRRRPVRATCAGDGRVCRSNRHDLQRICDSDV